LEVGTVLAAAKPDPATATMPAKAAMGRSLTLKREERAMKSDPFSMLGAPTGSARDL
jgi:hypothetical protein